jgi:MYXO-CTERM domain-containing protein
MTRYQQWVSFGLAAAITAGAAAAARANPALTRGMWQNITPASVAKGDQKTCIGQGLAVDRHNPSVIYWGNTPFTQEAGGLFKTTDGGATWARVAKVKPAFAGASDHLDQPVRVRIDPNDSNHLYAGDGVRGTSQGFFVSTDGGVNFVKPQGFNDAIKAANIDNQDIYDVAPDPTDFRHVLVSFHYRWGWTNTKWNTNSGVMESKDGGNTWIVHDPGAWSSGHSIKFLYNPALGIGNSQTWLLGTQSAGYYRTADAGATWTKVSNTSITHGGGDIYYSAKGVLYASGAETTMRSTDNGVTWNPVGPNDTWAIAGDGTTMFTGKGWGSNLPFYASQESDGVTWMPYSDQKIPDGPYEMVYDSTNAILYSSSWFSGVWALKLGDGTGVLPDGGAPVNPGTGGDPGTGAGGTPGEGGSDNPGSGGMTGAAGGDQGAGGTSTGAGGTPANGDGMGGGIPANAPVSADGGCACRAGHQPIASGPEGWAMLLLGMILIRRRGRK